MNVKKLSICLFTGGAIFATVLSLLFRFYQLRYFILVYEKYNPVPVIDIAVWITSMEFNRIFYHHIEAEAIFFDIVTATIFGLECVLIGLIFFKIWNFIKRKYHIKDKDQS